MNYYDDDECDYADPRKPVRHDFDEPPLRSLRKRKNRLLVLLGALAGTLLIASVGGATIADYYVEAAYPSLAPPINPQLRETRMPRDGWTKDQRRNYGPQDKMNRNWEPGSRPRPWNRVPPPPPPAEYSEPQE